MSKPSIEIVNCGAYGELIVGIYNSIPIVNNPSGMSCFEKQYIKDKVFDNDRIVVIQYENRSGWLIYDGETGNVLYFNKSKHNLFPLSGWFYKDINDKSQPDNSFFAQILQQVYLEKLKIQMNNQTFNIIVPTSFNKTSPDNNITSSIRSRNYHVNARCAKFWSESIENLLKKYSEQLVLNRSVDFATMKMSIFAGYYVERDVQRIDRLGDTFPDAVAINDTFSYFSQHILEVFAMEIGSELYENDYTRLVNELFMPLNQWAKSYVKSFVSSHKKTLLDEFNIAEETLLSKDVNKLFWLSTMQLKVQHVWSNDEVYSDILNCFDKEHKMLLIAGRRVTDRIVYHEESEMNIKKLVQFLLKFHFIAELSDPKCKLAPSIGEKIKYDPKTCEEILGKCGRNKLPALTLRDEVLVLFPGLTFSYHDGNEEVIFKCKVIRFLEKVVVNECSLQTPPKSSNKNTKRKMSETKNSDKVIIDLVETNGVSMKRTLRSTSTANNNSL